VLEPVSVPAQPQAAEAAVYPASNYKPPLKPLEKAPPPIR
jgi:hypothetical protein